MPIALLKRKHRSRTRSSPKSGQKKKEKRENPRVRYTESSSSRSLGPGGKGEGGRDIETMPEPSGGNWKKGGGGEPSPSFLRSLLLAVPRKGGREGTQGQQQKRRVLRKNDAEGGRIPLPPRLEKTF